MTVRVTFEHVLLGSSSSSLWYQCIAVQTYCSPSATEAVLLDVSGMKCGGCSAAVKRIIMENPEIKSAAVNLLTESAVFKVPVNADKEALGAQAAKQLTKQVQLVLYLQLTLGILFGAHPQRMLRTPL